MERLRKTFVCPKSEYQMAYPEINNYYHLLCDIFNNRACMHPSFLGVSNSTRHFGLQCNNDLRIHTIARVDAGRSRIQQSTPSWLLVIKGSSTCCSPGGKQQNLSCGVSTFDCRPALGKVSKCSCIICLFSTFFC